MAEQPYQKTISEFTDLELAEIISAQKDALYQAQANVIALQSEIERRKALAHPAPVEPQAQL